MHLRGRNRKYFLTCLDFSFEPLVGGEWLVWTRVFTVVILPNMVREMLGLFHLLSLSRSVTGSGGDTVFPWTTLLEFRGSPLWAGSTDTSEDARKGM